MRKILLIALLLVSAVGVQAQVSSQNAKRIFSGTAVPTMTCSTGPTYRDVYIRTTTGVWYQCTAAPNTWSVVSGGGSGTVTSIATTSPITGGTITATGTIACATCTTSAASLTSTALVTGAGSQALQTAAATATMDGSGNVSTPGSVSTGVGGSVAGNVGLGQGTATSVATNTIQFQAPTSVTGYNFVFPAAAFSGLIQWTNSSNVLTGTNATAVNVSAPQFCADAGANDTYACSLAPTPTLVTGTHYRFSANTANTGAATINFNTLGAKTIVKVAGGITTALADNDIRAGQWVDLVYDGTNMQMQSTLGNAGGGGITGLTTNTLPVATSATAIGNSFFVQGGDATNPTFRFGAADTSHFFIKNSSSRGDFRQGDDSEYSAIRVNGFSVWGAAGAFIEASTSALSFAKNKTFAWSDTDNDYTTTKVLGFANETNTAVRVTDGGAGYGAIKALAYLTATNCADSAGAAACGSAAAGHFVIDATTTSTVVSTTAITASSEVLLTTDTSVGALLSVTCNTQSSLVLGTPRVTARTAGTSFTVTVDLGPTANPLCVGYKIVN